MRVTEPGPLADGLHLIGNLAISLYLVRGGGRTALIDSGMTVMGPLLREDLEGHLGGPEALDLHLITHAHYDHVGCTPWLRRQAPDLHIAAHRRTGEIVRRPNAVALIRKLNETLMGGPPPADEPDLAPFEPFSLDQEVADGDRFDLGGGVTVEALHTPGHTRDSVSYWLPHARALVPAEAAGVPGFDGTIMPEFLQSYEAYMASLDRLARLPAEIVALPHNGPLRGAEARDYVARSAAASRAFRDRILETLDASDAEPDRAVARLMAALYHEGHGQPRDAFLLNLEAMVAAVAREAG